MTAKLFPQKLIPLMAGQSLNHGHTWDADARPSDGLEGDGRLELFPTLALVRAGLDLPDFLDGTAEGVPVVVSARLVVQASLS